MVIFFYIYIYITLVYSFLFFRIWIRNDNLSNYVIISLIMIILVYIMVVKITIQLVKSYDFTSQYRLNVLNRAQNSEMDKIGSKSGKIVKIGWNRDFTPDFTRLYQNRKCCATVPSSSTCQASIGLLTITQYTLTRRTKPRVFLHLSSVFSLSHKLTTQTGNNRKKSKSLRLSH